MLEELEEEEVMNITLVSEEENVEQLLEAFLPDRKSVSDPMYSVLVILYFIVGILAVLGNIGVILAFCRKKDLRTPRNIFIFNLAICDLLSATSLPLTVMDGFNMSWTMPNNLTLCRFVKTFPCVTVFMSSLTVMAIAMDRHRVIVHSSKMQVGRRQAWAALPLIFLISCLLSTIIFIRSTIYTLPEVMIMGESSQNISVDLDPQLDQVVFCIEDWRSKDSAKLAGRDRIWFTIFSSLVQFIIPLLVITIIYSKIYKYLQTRRFSNMSQVNTQKKTNSILLSFSLILLISWLPFSAFCIVIEMYDNTIESPETIMILFSIFHLLGMSTTITNPILYGFLNENITAEIHAFGSQIIPISKNYLKNRIGRNDSESQAYNQKLEMDTVVESKSSDRTTSTSVVKCSQLKDIVLW